MTRRAATLLIALIALTAASGASAGTARLTALGGDGTYVRDAANVLRWYADLVDYPDQVALEMGDPLHGREDVLVRQGLIGHGAGAHVQLDHAGRWGTAAVYFQDDLPLGPTDGAFTTLWGRRLGSFQLGLGGRFSTYGDSRTGTVIGDRLVSQYFHQYGAGLGWTVKESLQLELAGEVVNSQATSSGAVHNLHSTDDWTTFGLRARGFAQVSETLILVPVLDYARDLRGLYSERIDGPADLDAYRTLVGMGGHLRTGAEAAAVFNVDYLTGREDLDVRTADTGSSAWDTARRDFYRIRVRVGVEADLLPWLTVRAAGRYIRLHDDRTLTRMEDASVTEQHVVEGVSTPLAIGIGLAYRGMTADVSYNDTVPLDAGYGLVPEPDTQGSAAITLGWVF